MSSLGRALKQIRVFHNLKQFELADKLGISASYLSEIEKGIKEPSMSIMDEYSKLFKIPKSSILFFVENIEKPRATKNVISKKIITMLEFISYEKEV